MTIKQIAEKAEVSIGTVDRVIHNRGRVSEDTRKKVLAIIQNTGYRPNIHASNLSSSKNYTFAVIMPKDEQDSGFWKLPKLGARKAAEEVERFQVSVRYYQFDRYSEEDFLRVGRRMLEDGVDCFAVAPVMPEVAVRFIRHEVKDMPFVVFDSPLPEVGAACFIGQDSFRSGMLSAKLMSLLVPTGHHIAAIQSVNRDHHIRERIDGFLSWFPNTDKPVKYDEEHLDDPETCKEFIDDLLKKHKDLKGVFVSNASAHRVAKYLEDTGIHLHLVGYDILPEYVGYLERGAIDFLISQRPGFQGYSSIMTLYRMVVLREKVPVEISIPLDILTKENIKPNFEFSNY